MDIYTIDATDTLDLESLPMTSYTEQYS